MYPSTLEIIDENSKKIIKSSINGSLAAGIAGIKDIELNLTKINIIESIKDINNHLLESGSAHFVYSNNHNSTSLKGNLQFGELIKLSIASSDTKQGNLHLHVENFPILLHKVANKIVPHHDLLRFFRYSIQSGHIKQADISFNPSAKNLSKESLYGTVKIQKLDYKYDDIFPTLNFIDTDVILNGAKTQFIINKAYSSKMLLSKGIIDMDWKGLENTTLYINAIGNGPINSLTDFIHPNKHKSMNKANIDLRKIKGTANATIYIEIPLKPGSKNLYDIKAKISSASLNIFKNNIKLRKTKISGEFNGKQVILHGVGKLNNFNTDLNFIYNIEDQSEFNHKLYIRTHFKALANREQKIAFVSLVRGETIIDIDYLNKNDKGYITVDSDISNLELYFDKLGIRKEKNVPARIKVDGVFNDATKGVINFHTYNNKDLSIKGSIKIENNKAEIDLEEIKNKKTNIYGKIYLFNNKVTAELRGKTLDLSDSNMLQFLEKEREGGKSTLRINIDQVKLQDNIWLEDLKLMFKCDKDICFSGYIDSKIGSRNVEMLLTAEDDHEYWLIKCGNAGALLKGLGAYDSMKSGSMILKISTSRKEVQPGKLIPILDGTFTFERFKLQDTPAMTKLVSFISLPGFISLISGNKDIFFSGMSGNFSFENNLLLINNSFAMGPYFDFSMKGNIDIKNRQLDINGYVNPALYGAGKIIGSIPIIGRILTGNKKHRGLVSGTYKIQEKY